MDKNVPKGDSLEKRCILKVNACKRGIICEHKGEIHSLVIRKLNNVALWELQSSLGNFDYTLTFVVVLLEIGQRTEDAD